jgi:hypothetical protein
MKGQEIDELHHIAVYFYARNLRYTFAYFTIIELIYNFKIKKGNREDHEVHFGIKFKLFGNLILELVLKKGLFVSGCLKAKTFTLIPIALIK